MIVFCTTSKGRAQHVELTLPRNLADNADYEDCRFVLVDYGSHDHLVDYLALKHRRDIDTGRLVVYNFPEPGPFRMAHAKNIAHRLGLIEGADILVNLDADNYTGPGFARYVAEQLGKRETSPAAARVQRSDRGKKGNLPEFRWIRRKVRRLGAGR
jgi:hypothetical protein